MGLSPVSFIARGWRPKGRIRAFVARTSSVVAGLLAVVVLLGAVGLRATPGQADHPDAARASASDLAPRRGALRYQRPVDGAVLRGFAPPSTAFGSGHRGVDLDASPGQTIHAAGTGRVHHAGPVAGTVWVSLAHPDGVLTSYGPMGHLAVSRGGAVARGGVLGYLAVGGHGVDGADRGLHWGARYGGRYIDPLSLLDEPPGRPSLVGPGGWRGAGHAVRPYAPYPGGAVLVPGSPVADRPGYALPPNPNHLVLLPGFGTATGSSVLDPSHLGYPPHSVTEFSYAGGLEVMGPDDDPLRNHHPYGPEHTWAGVDEAARQLAEQLREQHRREPGRPVDLVGHSMGGVVALWFLLAYHDPYDPTMPQIGHVVTIGSPIRGSDLATIAQLIDGHRGLGWIAELQHTLHEAGINSPITRIPLDAPAIAQLAPGSPQVQALADQWAAALLADTAGPLATGTRVITIAAANDQVVGPHAASLPDAGSSQHVVLPGGHSDVLNTEAVRQVVWEALAGQDIVVSEGVLHGQISQTQAALLEAMAVLLLS